MRFQSRNIINSSFVNFKIMKKSFFLSISVFRGFDFTKYFNIQKIPKLPTSKFTKHSNAPRIPKIFGNLLIDARILEFFDFLNIIKFREVGE